MYSLEVSKRNLDRVQKGLPFTLKRHSVLQVHKAIRYFEDKEGELNEDEVNFIRNERIVSKYDFRYWATRYAWITRAVGTGLVRFVPNIAQWIVLDVWARIEERGVAILILQLKARQLGISTLVQLAITHRVQFWPHVNALVAASDPAKTLRLADKAKTALLGQPWWLLPEFKIVESKEHWARFPELDSKITLQHGTMLSDIARGDTPTVAHLTEIPDWRDPDEHVESSLIYAMHESPETLLVIETTAAGLEDWLHKTWTEAKETISEGYEPDLYPIFLPWFVGRDIYPTPGWLTRNPVPDGWAPGELTASHASKAREYVMANPLLKVHLGERWEMPREQQWYWEHRRERFKRRGKLHIFYSQMPASDDEAFQSTGSAVIDAELIAEYRDRIRSPVGLYAVTGPLDEIPLKFHPSKGEVDSNKSPITVRASWNPVQPIVEYKLVPLKFEGYSSTGPTGNKLWVWEEPKEGETYGLGWDCSYGIGQDNTAGIIIKKGRFGEPDVQVAEFATPWMAAMDAWPVMMAVGTWYAGAGRVQPRQVIECYAAGGEVAQKELQKRGWHHFHQWEHYDVAMKQRSNRIGWYTNHWSRDAMLEYIIKAFKDQWIDIRSPWLLNEASTLESDERQKLQAMLGRKDDRFMALAMVYFSLHVHEINSPYMMKPSRRGIEDFPTYRQQQGRSLIPYQSGGGYFEFSE